MLVLCTSLAGLELSNAGVPWFFLLVGNAAWLWEREKVQQELWGLALLFPFLFSSPFQLDAVGVQLLCVTKKCGDSWSDPLLIASSLRSPAVKFSVKVLEPEL